MGQSNQSVTLCSYKVWTLLFLYHINHAPHLHADVLAQDKSSHDILSWVSELFRDG